MTENAHFNSADLLLPNHKATKFLLDRLHIPSDIILQDIKSLVDNLSADLTTLINNDYATFISLGSNLVGTDVLIEDLRVPLHNLIQHLEAQHLTATDQQLEIQSALKDRRAIVKEREEFETLLAIQLSFEKISSMGEDLDIAKLERWAGEYSQFQYLISKASKNSTVSLLEKEIDSLKLKVIEHLQRYYQENFTKNEFNGDEIVLLLRISVTLGTVSSALEQFNQSVIEPFLLSLQGIESEIEIFNRIGDWINNVCSKIQTFTNPILYNTDYNFTILCWDQIANYIMKEHALIFHVTVPSRFQSSFAASQNLVLQFENLLDADSIIKWQNSNTYKDYTRRWQLNVYFQLICNQYAGELEQALNLPEHKNSDKKDIEQVDTDSILIILDADEVTGLKFQQTRVLYSSLQVFWKDDVCVKQLAHKFWRATLLFIKRYVDWFKNIFELKTTEKEEFMLVLYTECDVLESLVEQLFPKILNMLGLTKSDELAIQMHQILSEILKKLPRDLIFDRIIESIIIGPIDLFSNMSHIPAQYRGPNLPTPTNHSAYIDHIFKQSERFLQENNIDSGKWRHVIANRLREALDQSVRKTLDTISQIGESLRILKRKKNGNSELNMRTQILLDVKSFESQARLFGVELNMNELVELIELQIKQGQETKTE